MADIRTICAWAWDWWCGSERKSFLSFAVAGLEHLGIVRTDYAGGPYISFLVWLHRLFELQHPIGQAILFTQ